MCHCTRSMFRVLGVYNFASSLKYQKFSSITTTFFFLTVGQNNFGNKIPCFDARAFCSLEFHIIICFCYNSSTENCTFSFYFFLIFDSLNVTLHCRYGPKKDNLHRKLILQSVLIKDKFRTFVYEQKTREPYD